MKNFLYILKRNVGGRLAAHLSLLTILLSLSIATQAAYIGYSTSSRQLNGFSFYTMSNPSTNVYEYTITGLNVGNSNFIAYSTNASFTGIYSNKDNGDALHVSSSGVTRASIVDQWGPTGDYSGYRYWILEVVPTSSTVTIRYNTSTMTYTVNGTASYTVTVNVTGGTIGGNSSQTYSNVSSYQDVTVTPSSNYGYQTYNVSSGSATFSVQSTNNFRITPSSNCTVNITYATCSVTATAGAGGSITSSATQSVAYGGSLDFTYSEDSGYALDFSNCSFSGSGSLSNPSSGTITVSGITSGGTLSVAFRSTASSSLIVYYGSYPTQEDNTVTMSGFLADMDCAETVTAAGFYYGTSISAVEAHSSSIAATTPASVASIRKGSVFSATKDDFTYTTGTYIYFQAYVTTASGTGYSDIVGFFYTPCGTVSTPVITPSSVSLANGFSQTFNVVVHNAGKHPVYVWKLDGDVIDGATSDTYTYTSDGSAHTLRVDVTGDCSSTNNVSASITTCSAPTISSYTYAPAAPTDWEDITLSVGGTNIYTSEWEWSVDEDTSGDAAISNTSSTATSASAVFRAKDTTSAHDGKTYYVTYTAKGNCTGDVKVSQTLPIVVSLPSEQCTND